MRQILVALTLLTAVVAVACASPLVARTSPAAGSGAGTGDADARPCVLITGANRGLGLEFAAQYAAAGWDVIGTARRPDAATELAKTGATVLALDVADPASIERLVRELDGRPVDLLINNAGISSRSGAIGELDADRAARAITVNLLGPMRVTSALMPNLRAGERKQVVGISSQLGSIGANTSGGYYGYRESKAGLNMFVRSLAADLRADGFTCVVLSPGWVRTDMGGEQAPLSPTQSVTGMRTVIDGLTPARTGTFINHDGAVIPW
jgi:NAD(P)-dependent dehydrogenase (short-subunit alcohol dehydrogenase family)